MALVTIIKEIVKVGIKLNRKYKYLNVNDKFIRKYVPPGYRKSATRAIRIGEGIAIGFPIYEAIESGLRKTQNAVPYQNRQTRKYMESPRSGRFKYTSDKSCYRRYRKY